MIDRPAIIGTSSAALVPNGYAVHAGGGGGGGAIRVDQLGAGELSQLELTTLFGRTHLGLAACDASGEMTFLSPALQELLGQPFRPHAEAEQVERYHLSEGDGSTRLRAEEVPLARARLGETVTDAVICSRSNTGNLLYLLCNALPVRCPEARPVPQAERLTARVMLDDHVRVDDAHRRRRIPSRDAAHGEAPGVRAVAVAVGAGDEAVCEFVVAERVPPVVVALRSDGRRSAAQCGLHHEQRRSSCELGNEPQGPAATRPQDGHLHGRVCDCPSEASGGRCRRLPRSG